MRALITTTIATIAGLVPVAAFAAGGRVDDSGMFVWIFLGFCALIVVAQIVPALLLMFGLAKGIGQVVTEKNAAPAK
jgi:hypothetical protein